MKALIEKVTFKREFESKFGTLYTFEVRYNKNTPALYNSKKREQNYFIEGQEAEFIEETKTFINKAGEKKEYKVIKPAAQFKGQSNYGKALNKEQSRYAGFSESYVKDLLGLGLLKPEITEADVEHNDVVIFTWKKRSFEIFEHMVELDKSLMQ